MEEEEEEEKLILFEARIKIKRSHTHDAHRSNAMHTHTHTQTVTHARRRWRVGMREHAHERLSSCARERMWRVFAKRNSFNQFVGSIATATPKPDAVFYSYLFIQNFVSVCFFFRFARNASANECVCVCVADSQMLIPKQMRHSHMRASDKI